MTILKKADEASSHVRTQAHLTSVELLNKELNKRKFGNCFQEGFTGLELVRN